MPDTAHLPASFDAAHVSLHGRNILIAGADTDLGHGIARDLSAAGAALILQTTRQRGVGKLYDEIANGSESEPLIAEINLAKADPGHLATLATGLAESIGCVDSLIYLDAPSSPLAPFALVDEQQVASALEQGVMRPLRLIQALLHLLQASTGPSIVFQTWAAGASAKPYWSANGIACAGLANLAATLAAEHESFRVSTIDFGKVASALRHRAYPAEARSTLRDCDDRLILDSVRYLTAESTGEHLIIPDLDP